MNQSLTRRESRGQKYISTQLGLSHLVLHLCHLLVRANLHSPIKFLRQIVAAFSALFNSGFHAIGQLETQRSS
jgi:hypothetical protein